MSTARSASTYAAAHATEGLLAVRGLQDELPRSELRERTDAATATATELRAALQRLASAKRRQRRRVTAELRASGLLL